MAEFRIAAPARNQRRMSRPGFGFEFNRFELKQKGGESIRRHLWFGCHESDRVNDARAFAQISCQLQACGIAGPEIVEQKETDAD